jgi:hypothetical protein
MTMLDSPPVPTFSFTDPVMRRPFGLLILLTLSAAPLAAQSQWKTEFIVRKGKDTVSVERFTRDAGTLSGDIKQSNGLHTEYVFNLRPDNTVEHVEMSRQPAQGASATLSVDFGDTLVKAEAQTGGQTQKFSIPTFKKPQPFLLASFALFEQIVRASKPVTGKSVSWVAVRLGAGDTITMTLERVHADSVTVSAGQVVVRLAVSPEGDVLGATYPPQSWVVERKAVKP